MNSTSSNVIKIQDISFKNIFLSYSNPFSLSFIRYYNNNLLIQTPKSNLYINKKKNYASLIFNEKNSFLSYFLKFEKKIHKSLKQNKEFRSNINLKKKKYYLNLNIEIDEYKKPILSVFDHTSKSKPLDYIRPFSDALSIITPKYVYTKNNSIRIHWILVQTKVFLPVLYINECLIKDDISFPDHYHKNIIESKPKSIDTKYNKYIQMHKVGININAIQQKMNLDNIDPTPFYNYLNIPMNNLPKLPKYKQKLKTIIKPLKKPIKKPSVKKFTPTQTDIINALKSLRSIS